MQIFKLFLLVCLIAGCNTKPKTKYHILKKSGIYLETSSQNVSAHCTPVESKEDNSLTYIYVFAETRIDEFIFRRAWPIESCYDRKSEINKILAQNKRVRLSGFHGDKIEPNEAFGEDDTGSIPQNPEKLPRYYWIFERIDSGKSCHAYFENDCNGPPLQNVILEN